MFKKYAMALAVTLSVLFSIILCGWPERVQSQDKYPTRAIQIRVGVTPGGGLDRSARIVADYLSKKWNVPINVINSPGGRQIPNALDVHRAAPDGYTMLADSVGDSALTGAAEFDLPFNVMDRTFIATINTSPFAWFVPSTSPFKTIKDFLAAAKGNPKSITFTAGPSSVEFGVRQLFSAAGVDITKARAVRCKGASEAITLAAGGHVSLGATIVGTALPALKGGTIRVLIVSTEKRFEDLPEVPTTKESGLPEVDFQYWTGISGPPKLPSHIVNKWEKDLKEMTEDPEIISILKKGKMMPYYFNSQETRKRVEKQMEEMKNLLKIKI